MRKLGITIQFDANMYSQIKQIAEKNHIAFAAQVRLLLSKALEEEIPCQQKPIMKTSSKIMQTK